MMTTNSRVADLDDRVLLNTAKRLATDERRATASLLRAIMEIDRRRLYRGEGCASMFAYCTQVLRLSEGGAYNRIEAARAAREYAVILELFEQSAITLTAVRLLAPHLTPPNHVAVLASARHQSKRRIEELVVSLRPKPDAPVVVRRLPAGRTATAVSGPSAPSDGREDAVAAPPAAAAPRRDVARQTPLSPARRRDRPTSARAMSPPLCAERCGGAMVDDVHSSARKGGAARPHFSSSITLSRTPSEVRPSKKNIQLRCRAHNVYEAELFFGTDLVREERARWG